MAYNTPDNDSVDFTIESYTSPDNDVVDFKKGVHVTATANTFTAESAQTSESAQIQAVTFTDSSTEIAAAAASKSQLDAVSNMLRAVLPPLGRIGIFGRGNSKIENKQV